LLYTDLHLTNSSGREVLIRDNFLLKEAGAGTTLHFTLSSEKDIDKDL
jgi:hypothetical protein